MRGSETSLMAAVSLITMLSLLVLPANIAHAATPAPYSSSKVVLSGLTDPIILGINPRGAVIFAQNASQATESVDVWNPETNATTQIASFTDPSGTTPPSLENTPVQSVAQDSAGNLYYVVYYSTNLEQIVAQNFEDGAYGPPTVIYQNSFTSPSVSSGVYNGTGIDSIAVSPSGTLYFVVVFGSGSMQIDSLTPQPGSEPTTLYTASPSQVGVYGELVFSGGNLYFFDWTSSKLGATCYTGAQLGGAIDELSLNGLELSTILTAPGACPWIYLAPGPNGVYWAYRTQVVITSQSPLEGTEGTITNGMISGDTSTVTGSESFPLNYLVVSWFPEEIQVGTSGDVFENFGTVQWAQCCNSNGVPYLGGISAFPATITLFNSSAVQYSSILSENVSPFPYFVIDSSNNVFYSLYPGNSIYETFAASSTTPVPEIPFPLLSVSLAGALIVASVLSNSIRKPSGR